MPALSHIPQGTFISYRHSGEDPEMLRPLLTAVQEALGAHGIKTYCTFFDDSPEFLSAVDPVQKMEHAFQIIEQGQFLFVLHRSNDKSEGMLLEVGYCRALSLPVVCAVHSSVNRKTTYVPGLSNLSIEWDTVEDLVEAIAKTDFQQL